MMRFDFLRDAPPAFVERMRPSRIPEALRTPFAALVTSVLIVNVWFGIETLQIRQSEQELAVQKARAVASRADLAQTKIRRTRLEALIALDTRVRGVRRSGAVLASHFADLANHVPDHAWLTSISRTDAGIEITGDAVGLDGLSSTIADLLSSTTVSSPALVRAARDDRSLKTSLLAFEIHTQEHAQ